jgi:hypothetical protein
MRKSKAKPGEKICQVKATLSDWSGNVRGHPYRVIAIPEGFTLYRLAEAIVDSFGFYFDHAFGFYSNIRQWTKSEEGYELFADIGEESKFDGVERTKVGKVFHETKKKMLFLFDYGDEWHFIVELKGIEPQSENAKYPFVVQSVGDAPPQYGGPDEEDEF